MSESVSESVSVRVGVWLCGGGCVRVCARACVEGVGLGEWVPACLNHTIMFNRTHCPAMYGGNVTVSE